VPARASSRGLERMPGRPLRSLATAIVTALIAASTASAGVQRPDSACVAFGAGGVVATACPQATAVGVRVLEAGGNAVDAAIAVGFALAVTYPRAGNIGGGGFLLMRSAGGDELFIDFRETAPTAADRDMYLDADGEVISGASLRGCRAAGVPGTVAGLHLAAQLRASMPWEELLEPAIRLAGDGFPVDRHLHESLVALRPRLDAWPGLSVFYGKDGSVPDEGEVLIQPRLAATLRRLADSGPEDFYTGATAAMIVEEMHRGGGLITAGDLAAYRALVREPIHGSYRGRIIISAPPPSSGGIVLLEILNILEGFDMAASGPGTVETIHRMVEADKRAYADRAALLGDPDFVSIPVERLISKEYADARRRTIGHDATSAASIAPAYPPGAEPEETTHYSILDRDGNVVAVTTTLNGSYGSYVVVSDAGFLLNNEMDDFSAKPGTPNLYGLVGGEANAIEPGKRMLSSMTPTIVLEDGSPILILGSPGGSTIITTVAQILSNVIDHGMSAVDAVAAPRLHHQWMPDTIYCEKDALGPAVEAGLHARGYALKTRSPIGDAQVIEIRGGVACGVPDPRAGGAAGVTRSVRSNETNRKER